ncbi:MAG TPA: hypothetical protein VF398_04675 [bacterium]|jgi:hypothetical protein
MNNSYNELRILIAEKNRREHECRKYLCQAKHILVPEAVVEFCYLEKEYRTHTGDSDYVISAKVILKTSVERVRAYVWELKAPQCSIFEKDTMARLRPSKYLIDAENKLIHYYDELKGSDRSRSDFKVIHPDDIRIGGIIIGKESKWVSGITDESQARKLKDQTLRIREKYRYDSQEIKIITWDRILRNLLELEGPIGPQVHEGSMGVTAMPTGSTMPFDYKASK